MRKIIASMAAGGVLVAGAFVASTITSVPAGAQTATTQVLGGVGPVESVYDEVLAALVDDNTLTQDQADAVKEAFAAKHDEMRAVRDARREERQAEREMIVGFLEDDVIDADELAQLPDDHPFRNEDGQLAEALDDGVLTRDELREAAIDRRQDRRDRRHGFLMGDAVGDDAA